MKKAKKTKKIMTHDQLAELEAAENQLEAYREDVATLKPNVHEAERDTREAQANLKKEKNHLAKAEKDLAVMKKRLAKLKAKYKGWAKPKTDASPAGYPSAGAEGDDVQVPEGMP